MKRFPNIFRGVLDALQVCETLCDDEKKRLETMEFGDMDLREAVDPLGRGSPDLS